MDWLTFYKAASPDSLDNYIDMGKMPWNLVQIILFLLFILPIFYWRTRPMAGLALEQLQLAVLTVFTGFGYRGRAQKLILLFQFSHFKIMDWVPVYPNQPSFLGYYDTFGRNVIFIIAVFLLLIILAVLTIFILTSVRRHLLRVFVRMVMLVFLPLNLYTGIAIKTGKSGELVFSIAVYAMYALLYFCLVKAYWRMKFDPDVDAGDKAPSALLEFRAGFKRENRRMVYLFNVLWMPVFKVIIVAWALGYNDKQTSTNVAGIVIITILWVVLTVFVRPFARLVQNLLLVSSSILVTLILSLGSATKISSTIDERSETIGSVLMIILAVVCVLSTYLAFSHQEDAKAIVSGLSASAIMSTLATQPTERGYRQGSIAPVKRPTFNNGGPILNNSRRNSNINQHIQIVPPPSSQRTFGSTLAVPGQNQSLAVPPGRTSRKNSANMQAQPVQSYPIQPNPQGSARAMPQPMLVAPQIPPNRSRRPSHIAPPPSQPLPPSPQLNPHLQRPTQPPQQPHYQQQQLFAAPQPPFASRRPSTLHTNPH